MLILTLDQLLFTGSFNTTGLFCLMKSLNQTPKRFSYLVVMDKGKKK